MTVNADYHGMCERYKKTCVQFSSLMEGLTFPYSSARFTPPTIHPTTYTRRHFINNRHELLGRRIASGDGVCAASRLWLGFIQRLYVYVCMRRRLITDLTSLRLRWTRATLYVSVSVSRPRCSAVHDAYCATPSHRTHSTLRIRSPD